MKKMLTVEIWKPVDGDRFEMAGRCCLESINVGDQLRIEGAADSLVEVDEINLYGKNVKVLDHGYVATLWVRVLRGTIPTLGNRLIQ